MTLSNIRWDMIMGGFGLFMFGIQFMGDGLKSVAGDRMRDYINKYTSHTFTAILIGMCLTMLMQSSSASTAITIGFVRAGLMNLQQAAGIVMGANIGTTITSLLISLNIEQYSMYIVFVGCMLVCFGSKRRIKYWGNVILGFGLIFFGLMAMGDTLTCLKDLPEFEAFALKMSDNPILSMLTGAGMTAIVQSSAATIGIVQKLYQAGAISLTASLPFMFGANIGTTITGIIAAIGGSLGAKRTAGIHTMFNVVGTIVGMLILVPYTNFIAAIGVKWNMNPMMQIAVANIIFKTGAALCLIPFIKQLVALISKIIPGEEKERPEVDIDDLDTHVMSYLPAAAIQAGREAIYKMSDVVRQDIVETQEYLNKPGNKEDKELLMQTESLINNIDKKITTYFIDVSMSQPLCPADAAEVRMSLEVVKNLERVADLSMNIVEFYEMVFEDEGHFTPDAIEDMNLMFDILLHMFNVSVEIYKTRDGSLYDTLMEHENALDAMESRSRQKHFSRMSKSICTSPIASSVYCDILSNLERMGDHCCNAAKTTLLTMNEKAKNPDSDYLDDRLS